MQSHDSQEIGLVAPTRGSNRFSQLREDVEDALPYSASSMPVESSQGPGAPNSRRWLWRIAIALVVLAVAGVVVYGLIRAESSTSATGPCGASEPRLPTDATPTAYRIWLHPQFVEPYNFTGSVSVDVSLSSTFSGCLQLHAVDLTPSRITFNSSSGVVPSTVSSWSVDEEHERLHIEIPPGHDAITLQIDFSGVLNRNMEGLYLSTYTDQTGAVIPMVATQFEATSARRAFPCFDEPALKAEFSMVVTNVPDGFTALSNMPSLGVAPSAAHSPIPLTGNSVAFEPTVRMSTYLVALVVGKIDRTTSTAGGGRIAVSVWAQMDMVASTQFALDTAVAVLDFYETFYGINYPLPKADLVAIPDFAAGAMENWGLVTFRETALLADAATASQAALDRVAVVVAHELAHQWFGNLVTMEWWNGLWLNEGFATFMEFKGVNASHPQFEIYQHFQYENPMRAMGADQFAASHALSGRTVETSGEIEEQFDGISYSKGASIINMVANFLGSDTFSDGVRRYLHAHEFSNTVTADLWEALTAASGDVDLSTQMESYTLKPGVPLVTFTWNSDNTALLASQQRFFRSSYSQQRATETDTLWWIPLSIGAATPSASFSLAATAVSAGFSSREDRAVPIPYSIATDGWFKANMGQSGYYRSRYPMDVFASLAEALNRSAPALPVADRAGLIDDAFSVAFAFPGEDLKVTTVLDMLGYLPKESAYAVWLTALSWLNSLHASLYTDDTTPDTVCPDNLSRYIVSLLEDTVATVGWTPAAGESALTTLLRSVVLANAAANGHTDTITHALQLWTDAAGVADDVPSDFQAVVFPTVVRATPSGFTEVQAAYEAETVPATKRLLLTALAASTDPTKLADALSYAISDQVRQQDTVILVDYVARNPAGSRIAWEFVKTNWSLFLERYGSGGFAISSLVTTTASQFSSEAMLHDVETFFSSSSSTVAEIEVAMAVETIGGRMQWAQAARTATCDWLAARV